LWSTVNRFSNWFSAWQACLASKIKLMKWGTDIQPHHFVVQYSPIEIFTAAPTITCFDQINREHEKKTQWSSKFIPICISRSLTKLS
jgi:hypothetical protein